MASVNKVILVGNLGADPEVRYLPSGDAVANIRLATTDRYKDKASGEMKEATEWHRVSFFGRLAEIVSEYLKKGSSVYLEGRIRTRKWQAQDGTDRYSTEIVAEQMQMLGGRISGDSGGDFEQRGGSRASRPAPASRSSDSRAPDNIGTRAQPPQPSHGGGGAPRGGGFEEMDDDIPFGGFHTRSAWSIIWFRKGSPFFRFFSRNTSPSQRHAFGRVVRRIFCHGRSRLSSFSIQPARLLKKAARQSADRFFEHAFLRLSQAPT